MERFSMICSCGAEFSVKASSREEAVMKMRIIMSPREVARHFSREHPGEMIPPQAQVEAMIEHFLAPAYVAV